MQEGKHRIMEARTSGDDEKWSDSRSIWKVEPTELLMLEHGYEKREESRMTLGFYPWSNWEKFPFSEMGRVWKEREFGGRGEDKGCVRTFQFEILPALPEGHVGQAVDCLSLQFREETQAGDVT